ncbi:GNAT family N-acetyltransferase [Asanoa sp. WMMD1127]|uniref:GNAT family N-acetyltransferase n=1 Tax=Asanoa sp. WMMD1127 TaxID=3016107 RepID=UPI0024160269|nr:GNAT family N-acetyltransferase [Asanoa sp. WMMD1127]MDG4821918.1 GNAT family N-acetyltransferase [Asanoa sp. WMMD1127]
MNRALDDNLAWHASHLHRFAPGMRLLATGDVVVCDSGLADDTFNTVAAARFDGDVDARIASVLALLDRPYTWWVGPGSAPADLSDRLLAAGLPIPEREVAMWCPTGRRLVDRPVRVASTSLELADWAGVVAANWTPPSGTVVEFFARAAPWALVSTSRYLIGYADDVPVAAAELCYGGGVAGFYNVCTLEGARRQGWASALLSFGLDLAAAEGHDIAVLQAAQGAVSLYERLSFQPFGDVIEHAWRPH